MKPSIKLEVRASEVRSRLNEIAALEGDALTDEIRSESEALHKEYADIEVRRRAALVGEGDDDTTTAAEPVETPEDAARIELRSRARLGNYLSAMLTGRNLAGAEAELNAEIGASGIPLEVLDHPLPGELERRAAMLEKRADAPTLAGSQVGVNLQPILPSIFARAVVPRLGVDMPRVGSGTYSSLTITTDLTAGAKAAGVDQESTAAAFTGVQTTPHRVSARMSIRIEDIATIGTDNFESILRQNLQLAMSDRLDRVGLTGAGGNSAEPKGLFTGLTDPDDPGDVIDWAGFVKLAAGGIDGGPWAESLRDVVLVGNADVMRLAESTFQGSDAERSAAAYLRAESGGCYGSSRMPATAATIASVIRFRGGTMGLDGVDAVKTATCPVWAELGIDDIYSDSASGTRHFTLHSLIGDVLVHYPAAYERVDIKIASS